MAEQRPGRHAFLPAAGVRRQVAGGRLSRPAAVLSHASTKRSHLHKATTPQRSPLAALLAYSCSVGCRFGISDFLAGSFRGPVQVTKLNLTDMLCLLTSSLESSHFQGFGAHFPAASTGYLCFLCTSGDVNNSCVQTARFCYCQSQRRPELSQVHRTYRRRAWKVRFSR